MRFGTKLLLVFLPVVAGTSLVVMELVEHEGEKKIYQAYQAKALSIAASAASVIDGDLHATLVDRSKESSPEYASIRSTLRRVRDANRRSDTQVRFLYTVLYHPTDPTLLVYGVDTEENTADLSHLFDVVRAPELQRLNLNTPHVFDSFISDEFGTWLSAFYPIRNRAGTVVGAVGVDIDKDRVLAQDSQLHHKGWVALGLGVSIAFAAVLFFARRVSNPLKKLQEAMKDVEQGRFEITPPVDTGDEFSDAGRSLATMAAGLKERERVKSAFARYVSHQVADVILQNSDESCASIEGERRRITVLFSDIRGFTTMSEKLRPEQVVSILNEYFERMVDIVFRNHGMLDKFIGDGLMAIFGAPIEDPNQEEHALTAALEMREEITALAERVRREYGIDLTIGIGIHSGPAIVGSIGSTKRMEYTAIGDTVNLASRLESQTKESGVDIIFSEHTALALQGLFNNSIQRLGSVQVRGRADQVGIYTIDVAERARGANPTL